MDTAEPAEEETVDVLDLDLFADDVSGEARGDDSLSEDHDTLDADVQAVADEISSGFDFEKAFAAEADTGAEEPEEKEFIPDSGGFEEEPVSVESAQGLPAGSFEIPEELADISDLAPPAAPSEPGPGRTSRGAAAGTFEDALNLDALNLDDLELDELKPSAADKRAKPFSPSPPSKGKDSLSLDDIDLSGVLTAALPRSQNRPTHDDDLNFDLHLGGIGKTKGKDKGQKATLDDFPDFNLSLD
jgi:hypothetical protein